MSRGSNLEEQLRGLLHTTGANASDTEVLIQSLVSDVIAVQVSGTATLTYAVAAPNDYKVTSAYFNNGDVAITSAVANTKTFAVSVNGVSIVSQDSDAFTGTMAVNTALALSVNTSNSFVDAGEVILVTITHQAGPAVNGTVTLNLQKQ